MKSFTCVCLMAALFTALAMAAPSLSVSYIDGSALLGSGSSWKALNLGDPVPTESIVRLDTGSSVDLKGMGADFHLSQKGSYAIRDLLAARQRLGLPSVGAALAARLKNLLSPQAANQSSVAGVRGADQSKDSDSDWVETSVQDSLQQAKGFIQSENFADAINKLNQSLDEATAAESQELHFYLAYAYSLQGDVPDAARELVKVGSGAGSSWSGDFILLRAKLDLDSFAFGQAIQWLNQPGNDLSRDARRGSLYFFLLGLAHRGAGNREKEKEAFQRIVSMDKGSELEKAAAQMLREP